MNNATLAQIAALPTMSLAGIKQKWRDLYNADPPSAFNRAHLVNKLIYRLQELAWNGDTVALEKKLEIMSRYKLGASGRSERKTRIKRPLVGTKLIREYKNEEHHVTVLPDGFDYKGIKYRSLSRITEVITGTCWSGPSFFGLVERKSNNK